MKKSLLRCKNTIVKLLESLSAKQEIKLNIQGKVWGKDHKCKIGGSPNYIQDPIESHELKCNECGSLMEFHAQISSVSGETSIADSGMIYVFLCPNCATSKSFVQSY